MVSPSIRCSTCRYKAANLDCKMLEKPYSQACENNKDVILKALQTELADRRDVLEVGSGTGQHAVYFSEHLPHLSWQTSDQAHYHPGIRQWMAELDRPNIHAPLHLDVRDYTWGENLYDAVFTANSLHIMALESAQHFVSQVAKALRDGGCFLAYGPFNYQGAYTSESNARFDVWLKQQDPLSAIRDFEMLDKCARSGGLKLTRDYTMPANNRLLVWRKSSAAEQVSA
jgi:cyclopropane fatty-acyl-phospholipid synthase-like methyltransferase